MTVVDMTIPVHIAIAAEMGEDHGRMAARWFFDGNTAMETYAKYFKGIRAGDPEVLDELPQPDLSGQWADSYSSRHLYEDTGVSDESEQDTVCEAYGEAFSRTVEDEIFSRCKYQLDN